MKLQHIELENFRNHCSTIINCSPGINIILGNNGAGKTNILEGISYLCISRSFFSASDATALKIGENVFNVSGKIQSENHIEYEVHVSYDKEQNKKIISINKENIERLSSLIGQFPVVMLSPDQSSITNNAPVNRRRFIDLVISQSNKVYLENLINYRKVLKQRNKILSDFRARQKDEHGALEPWNSSLVQIGTAIIKKRIEFVGDIKGLLDSAYEQLAGNQEEPEVKYCPSFEFTDMKTIEEAFDRSLQKAYFSERRTGHSLIGPHRDEFVFSINGLEVQKYASQGQHKTFLVALKVAEFHYLKDKCNETPVLLLDDVLSELDRQRSQRLLEATATYGQVFITSTNVNELSWTSILSAKPRRFLVQNGKIENVEDAAQVN